MFFNMVAAEREKRGQSPQGGGDRSEAYDQRTAATISPRNGALRRATIN